jgi:hypothetical protein
MNDTHKRLSAELTGLEQQLNEHAAKGLEQELAGNGNIMAVARRQMELREAIAVKRRAVAAAQQQIDADTAAERQRVADDRRDQHAKLIDQLEKEATTLSRSLKRAAAPYKRMLELERSIREIAEGATGFTPGQWLSAPVGLQSYELAVAQISSHFPFKNMIIRQWHSEGEARKWSDPANSFAALFHHRDAWRNPPPEITDKDEPVEWVELKEMNDAA